MNKESMCNLLFLLVFTIIINVTVTVIVIHCY